MMDVVEKVISMLLKDNISASHTHVNGSQGFPFKTNVTLKRWKKTDQQQLMFDYLS